MNDETQQTDAGRLEKEEIEDLGTVTLDSCGKRQISRKVPYRHF